MATFKRLAYTDGSCIDYVGGWAYLILDEDRTFSGKRGHLAKTTNQVAELEAIHQLLKDNPGDFVVHTDSKYAIGCLTIWYDNWLRNGFRTASRKPVSNADLIRSIKAVMSGRDITFVHVFGHSGHEHNEWADRHANDGRRGLVGHFTGP